MNSRMVGLFLLATAVVGNAQEPTGSGVPAQAQEKEEEREKYEKPSEFEAEFVASSVFRSGTYLQPLWKGLTFEGHYFGGEHTDIGYTGAGWVFRLGRLKLAPGFGVVFGTTSFVTTPAVSIRWDFEKKWFVTQGLILNCFRESPRLEEEVDGDGHEHTVVEPERSFRPTISDGNHVSARWKRLTVGGTWEHIHFREDDEWKGGGRLAVRLLPRLSAVLYVLSPGKTEWRLGLLVHPKQGE